MADKIEKDPRSWVSGDDPITDAQASYLKTLSDQAGRPDPTAEALTKAETSELIDEMNAPLVWSDSGSQLIRTRG